MKTLNDLRKPLDAKDIEFRVQSISKKGWATILAYKDARADQKRLDDAVGALNWQRQHVNGNHNCIVSIWCDEKKQWVSKEDTGTESNTEKEKGLASDSFKRACFNWGIGRELYDYPWIIIQLKEDEFELFNGKPKQTYNLKLKEWVWVNQFENGELVYLQATDEKSQVRFTYPRNGKPKPQKLEWVWDDEKKKGIKDYTAGGGKYEDMQRSLNKKYKVGVALREEIYAYWQECIE